MNEMIRIAVEEDLPRGDLTTDLLGLQASPGFAQVVAKEDLIFSGKELFEESLKASDSKLEVAWHFKEGDFVLSRSKLCTIKGDLIAVLKGERVALNFLGHLCGVATLTRCYVNELEGTKTKILDTRKTLPGYRKWDKRAVLHGGGVNHRMNLSDAILVKENHIRVSGGITSAVEKIRHQLNVRGLRMPITVEVSSIDEVQEAVDLRVERVLLDNMDNELMSAALKIIPKGIETEASGNMTLERVRSVADLGVDFISIGALTHSAPCADVSMLFEWELT